MILSANSVAVGNIRYLLRNSVILLAKLVILSAKFGDWVCKIRSFRADSLRREEALDGAGRVGWEGGIGGWGDWIGG